MGGSKRFAATLLVATLVITAFVITAPAQASTASDESQFVSLINKERSSRGIGTLAVKADLVTVARQHSQDMANKGTIWHGDRTPYKISGWTVFGENVGMGPSVPDLHKAFMDSPSHREIILDREFNQIGVGIVVKDGTIYVTELFVQRKSSTTSAPRPSTSSPKPVVTTTAAAAAYRPTSSTASAPKPKPAPAKPAPVPNPRTVSLLVQLVGLDAQTVNTATGAALGV